MKPYYEDESVRLYHGDCREVLPGLEPVDLVLTDPPYGVRADQEWDDMSPAELCRFTMQWLSYASAVSDNLAVFCAAAGPMRKLCEMLYPRVRQIIWSKPPGSQYNGAREAKLWYSHDVILHCHDGTVGESVAPRGREFADLLREARQRAGLSRGAIDMAVRGKKTGLCYRWEEASCIPTSEQEAMLCNLLPLDGDFSSALARARQARDEVMDRVAEKAAEKGDVLSHRTITDSVHPCEKPTALLADLLVTVGHKAETVLDPFMGSGTTLVAAKNLARKAIGIEIEERYCEIAAERLSQGVLGLEEVG